MKRDPPSRRVRRAHVVAACTGLLAGACTEHELGAWGPPALIATVDGDDPTLTGDLLELYFDHTSDDIYVMTRASVDAPWSTPAPVAELGGAATAESTPEISADGLTMVFASDRAGGAGGLDVWISSRPDRAARWTAPSVILELGTPDHEFSASMSADALAIVLARPSGGRDLFGAARRSTAEPWADLAPLAPLNTPTDDSEPHLSADALALAFTSTRSGNADLYEARRDARDEAFVVAEPLPPAINTSAAETDPWVSPDRRHLVFVRGAGELWMSRR